MSLDAFLTRSDRLKAIVEQRSNLEAERVRAASKLADLIKQVASLDEQIAAEWQTVQTEATRVTLPDRKR